MPSTYSPDLRIELIGNGQQTGIWGNTTNTNLGTLIEQSIAGITNVTITTSNQALIAYNGVEDEARSAVLVLSTGAAIVADYNVYIPNCPKSYIVRNTSLSFSATIYASTALGNTTPAGVGVTIPPGVSVLIRTDGVDVFEQLNQIVGTLNVGSTLNAQANQNVTGSVTVSGSVFMEGNPQTVTINVNTPAEITPATTLPLNNTAVRFSATTSLPPPLSNLTTYYVKNRNVSFNKFNIADVNGTLINTTGFGSGVYTMYTVSLASTPPAGTNNSQLATTSFVSSAINNIPVTLSNWALSETNTSQAATISISPSAAVAATVTVATPPANGTAVAFTTTGSLPTGVTANVAYYVFARTASTYNLATTIGQTQSTTFATAAPNVFNVLVAPTNNQVVYFGAGCPSGITAGVNYFVVGATSTTFSVSSTYGGSAIAFTGTGTCLATWQSLVVTTGSQSGTHTENTSKLNFSYKTLNKMSIDLGGNVVANSNVTAFGTP